MFIFGDVLSFLMQASGGGLMAESPETMLHTSEKVIITGLFIQLLWFGFFIITSFIFHIHIQHNPTSTSMMHQAPMSWQTLLWAFYLLRHKVWLYIFDALLMAIVVILFNVCHPSKVLVEQSNCKDHNEKMNKEAYMAVNAA
ncbi:rta1 domain [Moniliophthora roreri]|nr:rta1 domain [Moniliophthora roreri]